MEATAPRKRRRRRHAPSTINIAYAPELCTAEHAKEAAQRWRDAALFLFNLGKQGA